jgi:lysosomal alpha-mannosidase
MWSPEFLGEQGLQTSTNSIFSSILYDHYYPPFVELQNNKNKEHFSSLKEKVKDHIKTNMLSELIPYFFEMSTSYRTSHVLLLMGDTFSYYDAAANFEVIDLIIENTKQANYNISIFYSTVSNYLSSVKKEAD